MINLKRLHVVYQTDNAKTFKFIICQFTQTTTESARTVKNILRALYTNIDRTPFGCKLL